MTTKLQPMSTNEIPEGEAPHKKAPVAMNTAAESTCFYKFSLNASAFPRRLEICNSRNELI